MAAPPLLKTEDVLRPFAKGRSRSLLGVHAVPDTA